MKKITSKNDAFELTKKMAENSNIELQIRDDVDEAMTIKLEGDGVCGAWITWTDYVTDTIEHSFEHLDEIADNIIWYCRSFINHSGQLATI